MGAIRSPFGAGRLNHSRLAFYRPEIPKYALLYKFFGVETFSLSLKAKVSSHMKQQVVKTESEKNDTSDDVRIYGVSITQHMPGCYAISVRHSGPFRLDECERLEIEAKSARIVKRC